MTIAPPWLAMSAKLDVDTEVLCLDAKLDISRWLKHRILDFSKLLGLPLSRYEKLCIAFLQRQENEMEAANLLHKEVTSS